MVKHGSLAFLAMLALLLVGAGCNKTTVEAPPVPLDNAMPVPGTQTPETIVEPETAAPAVVEPKEEDKTPEPQPAPKPITKPAPAPTEAPAAVQSFTITGSNFAFDVKTMTVKQGDKVRVTFKNAEGFHDWVLDEFKAATKKLGAGQEETIEFVADKKGAFEYYCSVGSHRDMGMKGTLTVQ